MTNVHLMADPDEELFTTLHRLAAPYRAQLMARSDRLNNQIRQLAEKRDQAYADAQPKIEALTANVPDTPGDEQGMVTAVELLTKRAAEADLELAFHTNEVATVQLHLKYTKAVAERDDLNMRIGQIDHLIEDSDPVRSPGNDDQLAIWTLHAHESALDVANAEIGLQFARRRLEHAKKVHREIHASLRREQLAEQADRQ